MSDNSSKTTPDFRLYDGLGYWVLRMARAMRRDLAARLAEHQLNDRTLGVLMAVGASRMETPSAIADHIGIDRAVVARTLSELRRRGLIRHWRNTDDGRSRKIALTEDGTTLLAIGTDCARAMNENFAAKMPKGQAERIRLLFKEITECDLDGSPIKPIVQSFREDSLREPGPR